MRSRHGNHVQRICARTGTLAAVLGFLVMGCTEDRDSHIDGGGAPGGHGDDGSTDDGQGPTTDNGADDGGGPTGDDGGDTTDDGGDTTAEDGSSGDPGPDVGGGGGDPPEQPDISECSHWPDVQEFFAYLNDRRGEYGGEPPNGWHDRYKGIPWEGEGHNNVTFPVRFTWDDGLAARAVDEAERLASGGAPAGMQIAGQNYCCREFWLDGLNTADWRLTHLEHPGDYDDPDTLTAAMVPANGSARLGFFYHDFGGDGPAINRMGVGAAMTETCEVWWVMQFGP